MLEAEELVRQLRNDHPALFDHIRNLPNGVRSSRRSDEAQATFVFCEAQNKGGEGHYRRLYLVNDHGEILTSDMPAILRRFACDERTATDSLPPDYNNIVADIQVQFEQEVRQRQTDLQHASGRALGREYVLQQLRILLEHTGDESDRQTVILLSNLFTRVPLTRRCHSELNNLRTRGIAGDTLVDQLRRIARDFGLEDLYQTMLNREDILIPRVICSEALN